MEEGSLHSVSDSDLEFWTSYSQVKPIQLPESETKAVSVAIIDTADPQPEKAEPTTRRELRLLHQIEIIRVSKRVEINDAIKVVKKALESQFQSKLDAEKTNFNTALLVLKKKIEDLAMRLNEKSLMMDKLNAVIADQAILLSEANIEYLQGLKHKGRGAYYKDIRGQKKTQRKLLTELNAMKEICKMYELDNIASKTAAMEALARQDELRTLREADKLKFAEELRNIEQTIKADLEAERVKNASFQADASSELQLREKLNSRQQDIIKALQDELKNAKAILQSKRLHSKYLEALKGAAIDAVPEPPIHVSIRSRSTKLPKALSTLPKLDRTVELQMTPKTPTLRHFKASPETLARTSIYHNTSFT